MSRITDAEMTEDAGDFRLIDRKAIDALNAIYEQHRFMRVWLHGLVLIRVI